jgi:hypothetical protein
MSPSIVPKNIAVKYIQNLVDKGLNKD